jgi:peptidoglycan hydrolase CwlO-like protein
MNIKTFLRTALILLTLIFSITIIAKAHNYDLPFNVGGTDEDKEELIDQLDELEDKIKEYEKKIDKLKQTEQSLQREIDQANAQISLTQLRIEQSLAQIRQKESAIGQLIEDIDDLKLRIEKLVESINYQENLLGERMRARYKSSDTTPLLIVFGSATIDELIQKSEYLKIMERQDRVMVIEMNETKTAYGTQKTLFEDKKETEENLKAQLEQERANLEAFRSNLNMQKSAKEDLLRKTQNDEQKFQQLLNQARQEFLALQAIFSGSGIEGTGVPVKSGQLIGSVIAGASCNSSGTHLHFTVRKNGVTKNPFNYLKKTSNYSNCSGPGSCSAADSFNPKGDWEWPIKGHITMWQGYGDTWAIKNTWVGNIYSFHDGIDISSPQLALYAVEDGIYYKGAYTGSGGCRLQYIRIDHDDGVQSYYLHVNY